MQAAGITIADLAKVIQETPTADSLRTRGTRKPTETRFFIGEERGWRIISVMYSTYEAKKDGENVTLETDSIEELIDLIKLREEKHGQEGN